MNKFVIASFLDKDFPPIFNKYDWPLHVTILTPFSSEKNREKLIEVLADSYSQNNQIVSIGKSREMVGPKENISVIELENTTELQEFHNQVVAKFTPLVQLETPWYSGSGFLPHVTDQKVGKISVGDEVHIDSMSLIEFDGDERRVLHTGYFKP